MENKVKIGQNSKVNIKWNVLPIDYSKDAEKTIVAKIAKKYGIQRDNVNVEPVFCELKSNGTIGAISNDITRNIQDIDFQRELFAQYISERNIEDHDFSLLSEIDDSINAQINYDIYNSNKKYKVKWIKWSNFMSYGPDNFFDFTTLKGLCLLTSEPANQGGKSTFCLDLLRFMLFGKVTSRENNWTLDKGFNRYIDEATEYSVEGCVSIDGIDYIINRTVTRPSLKKRTDKSKSVQKVYYYRLVNNEKIELTEYDNENETTNTETNKVIKESIGNERDFDLMICISSDNLKELISLKDTDRGRLISRWIGLLPLEDKDRIARETYNKTIAPTLLLNRYNKEECEQKIEELECLIKENESYVKTCASKISEFEAELEKNMKMKENLLESKNKIDETLTKVDVTTLQKEMSDIKSEGAKKRKELETLKSKSEEIGEVSFNEKEYKEKEDDVIRINSELVLLRNELKNEISNLEKLEKGEICPTCGAKLKGVDNSKAIEEKKALIDEITENGKKKKSELDSVVEEKNKLNAIREKYNEKIRINLLIQALEANINNLILKYKDKQHTYNEILKNKEDIEKNNKIDASINVINVNISTQNGMIKSLTTEKSKAESTIEHSKKDKKTYAEIISRLIKEEKLVYNWKIYLDMVGKNGISKLVIRNTLPLINGQLKALLSDVCDFDVEVRIDERNDVAFDIIHDGKVGNLGSGSGFELTVASLALRSVLSRISTFSKPSFIVFDEILGGAADVNYDCVKLLYDKITKDYDYIFEITHNKAIFDWHEKTIVVKKNNNISTIVTE